MKIYLFALFLAAISIHAMDSKPLKFASCEKPIPGKHYHIRAIPKDDVSGDEDPFSQTSKKYQTLTYSRPELKSKIDGGAQGAPLCLEKDGNDGYHSLFSVEQIPEKPDMYRIYSAPVTYKPGKYFAVKRNPTPNVFKKMGSTKNIFLEQWKTVDIKKIEFEDGCFFGIEENSKRHMIKNKDGKRFLMSIDDPDFTVSWKQTDSPMDDFGYWMAKKFLGKGGSHGFFAYIKDGPNGRCETYKDNREEFKFKDDYTTILFPTKNEELKVVTSRKGSDPMVFAKGPPEAKVVYFCFQSYDKPENQTKEEKKTDTDTSDKDSTEDKKNDQTEVKNENNYYFFAGEDGKKDKKNEGKTGETGAGNKNNPESTKDPNGSAASFSFIISIVTALILVF